jgi:hypothetical protein
MEEHENPLLSKTQIARLFGISIQHLNYYFVKYKFIESPKAEQIADKKLYRRDTVVEWWDSIKNRKNKEQ